jgi:hypothetical protein
MPSRDVIDMTVGQMSVAELAARSGRSVREIIDYALGDDAPSSLSTRVVDTRTAAGRYAYDQAVFAALDESEHPMSAFELRLRVGGTAQQIRAALGRLVEDEIVTATGQASATRYALA